MAAFQPPVTLGNAQQTSYNPRPTSGETSIGLNNADTLKFIQLYQQEELLWNVHCPDHINRAKRSECLKRISHVMGNNWTEQQVKDKILSLRSRYSKEIVKVRVSIASGVDQYNPVWRFFPSLDAFLRPFCTTRKTDTPVVRAFQKRLMGEMGQSSRGSSPSVVHPASQPVATAASRHFLGAMPPLAPLPSGGYYGNHQNVILPVNHHQNDNDDDVLIVEDYMAGMAQEEPFYIDDGDDEREEGAILTPDNGNSGFQRRKADSSSAYEDQGRSPDDQGHYSGDQGHEDSASHHYGELGLQTGDGESRDRTVSPAPVCGMEVEGQASHWDGTASGTSASAAGRQGNASEQSDLEEAGLGPRRLRVKRENPCSPPSPPSPRLPSRLDPAADAPAEEGSASRSGEAGTVHPSAGGQQGAGTVHPSAGGQQGAGHAGVDNGEHGQGEVPRTAAVVSPRSAGEPTLKKIKLENEAWGESADADNSSQGSEASTSLTGDACSSHRSEASTSLTGGACAAAYGANTADASQQNNGNGSQLTCANTSRLNHVSSGYRSTISTIRKNTAYAGQAIRGLTNSGTYQATNASSSRTARGAINTAYRAANHATGRMTNPMPSAMTSQMTKQVTNVVTSQMTNLLQMLVTNLVEKSSPGVTNDAEVTFVNHVVCELKKLDEDLQADVKFSIQKTIYEAQKEMRQRRTQQTGNAV